MAILFGILQFLSVLLLGLFVGALLAEGYLLVPYWRKLLPEQFFLLHKEFGPRLYRFYAPLTIAATLLTVSTAIISWLIGYSERWITLTAGILSLSMIAIYFIYFKQANESFAKMSISADDLGPELGRWASWHSLRVMIGIVAFGFAILGFKGTL
jgi:Domain of unknown function (DUF1772)